jgi:hypothetical protein
MACNLIREAVVGKCGARIAGQMRRQRGSEGNVKTGTTDASGVREGGV